MSDTLARQLVMTYGWNSTACQILNPGIDHWFSTATAAVIGYTRRHNVLLVAGAPICAPGLVREVCGEFEEYARRFHCRVCYVCAEQRLRALLADSPEHSAVTLGAQPVWDPRGWPQLIKRRASLRAQLNRSRNKGHEPNFSIGTLYSMGAAFSGIPPWQALTIGLIRAIRQEFNGIMGTGPTRITRAIQNDPQ